MRMTVEEAMALVEREMPAKRWKHTLGVVESAVALAERFGGDAEKARVAAILHDVAKFWPVDRQRAAIEEEGAPAGLDTLLYDKELWHSHAGAYAAKRDFGVADEEVLDAIRYHTSGRVGMTKLDKIICLADYIEPGRDFPGVDRLRELAKTSLEEALVAGFDGTIRFLLEQGKRIYPLTVLTRNDLITYIRSGGF
ncbi:MAG TPA: bis(5'-nucleosyl)-tetraphosphatase (symmetrical) YqeK [Paenibacillus sp.]|nr:bis(5'-nucleosyl)-tetraphosphatase (symmetrical) YqeK [Paenibacillus sp.]HZG84121.1 bis(5'-nucleosyl)-tetraphosphatase (symmetrical) YqeK [Paenibacillus sp.]